MNKIENFKFDFSNLLKDIETFGVDIALDYSKGKYRKRRNFRWGLIFVGKHPHARKLNPRKFVHAKNYQQ